jgi:hypothetical protein
MRLAAAALAGLLAAAAAWWRYRQQLPAPPPESQSYVGYGWQPLPHPERDDGALIEARERRQLVWNIEHFISDDPTRRLHLPRGQALHLIELGHEWPECAFHVESKSAESRD